MALNSTRYQLRDMIFSLGGVQDSHFDHNEADLLDNIMADTLLSENDKPLELLNERCDSNDEYKGGCLIPSVGANDEIHNNAPNDNEENQDYSPFIDYSNVEKKDSLLNSVIRANLLGIQKNSNDSQNGNDIDYKHMREPPCQSDIGSSQHSLKGRPRMGNQHLPEYGYDINNTVNNETQGIKIVEDDSDPRYFFYNGSGYDSTVNHTEGPDDYTRYFPNNMNFPERNSCPLVQRNVPSNESLYPLTLQTRKDYQLQIQYATGNNETQITPNALYNQDPDNAMSTLQLQPELSISTIAWFRDIIGDSIGDPGKEFILTLSQPKVAQKSYGEEKRFLTPPIVVLSGGGWGVPLECEDHPRKNKDSVNFNDKKEDCNNKSALLYRKSNHNERNKKALLLCQVFFSTPHPSATINFKPICRHIISQNGLVSDKEGIAAPSIAAFLQKLHIDALDPRKEVIIHYKIICPMGSFNIDAPPMIKLSKPSKRKRASFSSLLIRSNTIASFFNRTKSQSSSTTFLGSNGVEITPCNGPQEDWTIHLVSRKVLNSYIESLNQNSEDSDYHKSKGGYLFNDSGVMASEYTTRRCCHEPERLYNLDEKQLLSSFKYPKSFYTECGIDEFKFGLRSGMEQIGAVLHYGDIIVLRNLSTGFITCPFILRRVERVGWCIIEEECTRCMECGDLNDNCYSDRYNSSNFSECPNSPNRYIPLPATFFSNCKKPDQGFETKMPVSPLHRVAFEFALKPMHFLYLNTNKRAQNNIIGITASLGTAVSRKYKDKHECRRDIFMGGNMQPLYEKLYKTPDKSSSCSSVYDRSDKKSVAGRTPSPYSISSFDTPETKKNCSISLDVDVGEACIWTVISVVRKECTFYLGKNNYLNKNPQNMIPQYEYYPNRNNQVLHGLDFPQAHYQDFHDPRFSNSIQSSVNSNFHSVNNLLAVPNPNETLEHIDTPPQSDIWIAHQKNPYMDDVYQNMYMRNFNMDHAYHTENLINLDPIPEIYHITISPRSYMMENKKIILSAFGKNLSRIYLFFGTQNTVESNVSSGGNILKCAIDIPICMTMDIIPILMARGDGVIFKSNWCWDNKRHIVISSDQRHLYENP